MPEMLSVTIFIGHFYLPLIPCLLTELEQKNLYLICASNNVYSFKSTAIGRGNPYDVSIIWNHGIINSINK